MQSGGAGPPGSGPPSGGLAAFFKSVGEGSAAVDNSQDTQPAQQHQPPPSGALPQALPLDQGLPSSSPLGYLGGQPQISGQQARQLATPQQLIQRQRQQQQQQQQQQQARPGQPAGQGYAGGTTSVQQQQLTPQQRQQQMSAIIAMLSPYPEYTELKERYKNQHITKDEFVMQIKLMYQKIRQQQHRQRQQFDLAGGQQQQGLTTHAMYIQRAMEEKKAAEAAEAKRQAEAAQLQANPYLQSNNMGLDKLLTTEKKQLHIPTPKPSQSALFTDIRPQTTPEVAAPPPKKSAKKKKPPAKKAVPAAAAAKDDSDDDEVSLAMMQQMAKAPGSTAKGKKRPAATSPGGAGTPAKKKAKPSNSQAGAKSQKAPVPGAAAGQNRPVPSPGGGPGANAAALARAYASTPAGANRPGAPSARPLGAAAPATPGANAGATASGPSQSPAKPPEPKPEPKEDDKFDPNSMQADRMAQVDEKNEASIMNEAMAARARSQGIDRPPPKRADPNDKLLRQHALRERVEMLARKNGLDGVDHRVFEVLTSAMAVRLRNLLEEMAYNTHMRATPVERQRFNVELKSNMLEDIKNERAANERKRDEAKMLQLEAKRMARQEANDADGKMTFEFKKNTKDQVVARRYQRQDERRKEEEARTMEKALDGVGRRKGTAGSSLSFMKGGAVAPGAAATSSDQRKLNASKMVTNRDAIFTLERDRNCRKSQLMYKTYLHIGSKDKIDDPLHASKGIAAGPFGGGRPVASPAGRSPIKPGQTTPVSGGAPSRTPAFTTPKAPSQSRVPALSPATPAPVPPSPATNGHPSPATNGGGGA